MNETTLEPVRWDRRRWIVTITAIAVAEFALIAWFGARPLVPPRLEPPAPWLSLAADPRSGPLAEALALHDPTVFALPHLRSFSARAWTNSPASAAAVTNWLEGPAWLPLATGQLGGDFAEFVRTNAAAMLIVADAWKARPGAAELPTRQGALATQSRLRVTGALAQRPFAARPVLPQLAYHDTLPPTVVEVSVDAHGLVVTVVPIAECGVKAADQRALELARQLRFVATQPLRDPPRSAPPPLTWGRLIFDWATVAPDVTNQTAGATTPVP